MSKKPDQQRVRHVCCNCGSSDIVRNARAWWNEDQQQWVLCGLYDVICRTCGCEVPKGITKEQEIADAEPDTMPEVQKP
jgi:hypothetical protein